MYFYVDESGHTGLNLFDATQPRLYYGVLSSPKNLDVVAEPALKILRAMLNVDRIHASQLGNGELVKIAPLLRQLAIDLDIRFDLHTVYKPDHAIIQFFDQTFDQGVNPAVSWTGYWTPLRYTLLLKLSQLFDENMAKEAWEARIETNDQEAERKLINVCSSMINNLSMMTDARAKELIGDAMSYVIKNPSEICYNISSKEQSLQISPNLVGFQSVVLGIHQKLKSTSTEAKAIIVDRQSEFNRAQEYIHNFYQQQNDVHALGVLGMPEMDLRDFPKVPVICTPGDESAGLELVDVYLWIMKRVIEDKSIARELEQLCEDQTNKGELWISDVSLNAINNRWSKFFEQNMPDIGSFTAEELERKEAFYEQDEALRKSHLEK